MEYIISNVMILLTVCLIPFALKSRKLAFTLAAIILPLMANIALYIYYDRQPSFGYLAIIGAISLCLIRKKKPADKSENTSGEDDIKEQDELLPHKKEQV
ncbi:MAG: hypothetical protein HUK08_05930 [Bacteroidaceae bacterium]|nr:hypothetical protein [Bacteroidaceae bacterium]